MRDEALREKIEPARYVTGEIGLPTLNDILTELAKPGRDPRAKFEAFRFADGIEKIEDLTVGMKLPGIVTNITAFGAFVDIGVHQDGLIHLSQIADRYVKDPGEILKVRQVVEVTVLAVDMERKRISLTLKRHPDAADGAAVKVKGKRRTGKEGESAGDKPPQPRAERPRKEKPAPDEGPLPGAERGNPPREKTAQEASRKEEPPKKIHPRQDKGKPDQSRPSRGRARDEKVPFNNPFVAVFGKKPG
jgi:uncharacterized protein